MDEMSRMDDPVARRALRGPITATFACVMENPDAFTLRFYDRLFAEAPRLRNMFPADLAGQRRKFLDMLVVLVDAADNLGPIEALARGLGRQHFAYGARPAHYAIVTNCLMAALAEHCAEVFDDHARTAWAELLHDFNGMMLDGAAERAE